jgi:signal peptidase I
LGQRIRTLWTIYWALWFAVVPFVLACVFVKVLTPPSGVDAGGVIGWIESIVAEQAVPVGIVAFTLFEMALWAVRHQLPFAKHAYTPLRADIPEALRRPFERARLLLDDANTILTKKEKDVVRDLSAREREELRADLDQLQTAMDKDPFDQEVFVDSLVKADAQVDERLRRWRKSELREYMESILVAIGVALALRAFVLEAFKIPSGSMIPTLQVGDHIFVNKFIYGPAIPFTHSRLWSSLPPKRGDVMVHAFPEHPEQDFIKRVIAIPGDKLEARNGHPVINGWEVPHCYVGEYSYVENESPVPNHDGDLFVEYLGEAAYLTLYDHATGGFPEYQGPFLAKPGEVWVMGDNRNNSHDSRMWWNGAGGGVPFENIRGRAIFVWLSVNEGKVDWSRFGAPVMGRPRLPPDMHALQPALDKCLKDRPPLDKTTPPPPSPTQGQLSSP